MLGREARTSFSATVGHLSQPVYVLRSMRRHISLGFDLPSVLANPNWFPRSSLSKGRQRQRSDFTTDSFNPLMARILTFPSTKCLHAQVDGYSPASPVPTIAAINGHCFASGFILSLCCDYRVMIDGSKRNAWLCMNEVRHYLSSCSLFSLLNR